MIRYHITLGAYTTAGGYVVSASSLKSINGQLCVLEGDMIFCTRCGSHGYIVCNGPRIPEMFNDRLVALEGDYAVCKCMPSPTLITAQGVSFQTVEGEAVAAKAAESTGSVLHRSALNNGGGEAQQEATHDEQFLLKDSLGKPLAGAAYTAKLATGEIVHAETDDSGMSRRFKTDGAEKIVIYLGHREDV